MDVLIFVHWEEPSRVQCRILCLVVVKLRAEGSAPLTRTSKIPMEIFFCSSNVHKQWLNMDKLPESVANHGASKTSLVELCANNSLLVHS